MSESRNGPGPEESPAADPMSETTLRRAKALVDPWGDGPGAAERSRATSSTDPPEHAPPDEHLMLADRLTAVGTLAAGAAHEINNPLTYSLLNLDNVLRRLRIFSASGTSTGDAELAAGPPSLLGTLEHAIHG